MRIAYILTEGIHVFTKVMTGSLLPFKVNFDLMNVFLLLFCWLFTIVSDHCVDDGEYGATSVQAHSKRDCLNHTTVLRRNLVAATE